MGESYSWPAGIAASEGQEKTMAERGCEGGRALVGCRSVESSWAGEGQVVRRAGTLWGASGTVSACLIHLHPVLSV